MQNNLSLSVGAYCSIIKFPDPKISEINGDMYIWGQNLNFDVSNDAFNHPELIPELIQLVKKIEDGGNKNNLIVQWVKKWGVLKREKIRDDLYGQKLSSFWSKAKIFQIVWNLYKSISIRNTNVLGITSEMLDQMNIFSNYSEDPLENAQYNTMEFIIKNIQIHTKNGFLQAFNVKKNREEDDDVFKVEPAFNFHNLIDALYMQFLVTLTENKKICPTCDISFSPERKDKVYCSETCKLTAKSRRYRQRKKD